MRTIKLSLIALFVLLSLVWLAADTLMPEPFNYFTFRHAFIQYSGVLCLGVMTAAMLLAVRPKWLEPYLDGLDKMYRLHKWLGISALILAIAHWWWARGTKWMVGWGWLVKPRGNGQIERTDIELWIRTQRGLAESIGEWAFYLSVLLILLALIKRFPYHWFKKTHKLFAVAYLFLAYHAIILTDYAYWFQPIGWLIALMLIAGCVAAIMSLFDKIGKSRQVQGHITSLMPYPALNSLKTVIQLQPGWPGHNAGQFAFVTSDEDEGAHPYTIASSWNAQTREIAFITKALGDHTSKLAKHLKVGMEVSVEGPYGCFDFDDHQPQQIWIGAGIGITPFIARMQQLAENNPRQQTIDLFHPTAELDSAAIAQLQEYAHAAHVRLHIWHGPNKKRLDAEAIREAVIGWHTASIWFCGPPAFGQALQNDFIAAGLPAYRFHQELFQMR